MPDRISTSPWGLLAAAATLLLLVGYSPAVDAGFWAPKAAVALVLLGAALPLFFTGAPAGLGPVTWAARGFVAWAALSTAASGAVVAALVGLYNAGTGLVFVLVLVAGWLVGTRLRGVDRRWIECAILAGAGINIAVAILEMAFDLRVLQLRRVFGRAPGLLGNPVFLGVLLACAVPLALDLARRARRPWMVAGALVTWGAALRLSGGRAALVLALVALGWCFAAGPRRAVVAACSIALFVGALAAPLLDHPPRDTTRATASVDAATAATSPALRSPPPDALSAGEQSWLRPAGRPLSPRLSTWWAARAAVARHPLLGAGPGRFRAATVVDRPLVVARDTPDQYFADAHNLVIEYAVTTGLPGLVLLCGWLFLALARLGRRPDGLGMFAVLGLIAHLIQPQYVGITPVIFLALGAAATAVSSRTEQSPRVASVLGGAAGALVGGVLLLGVFLQRQASLDYDLAVAERATSVLAPWPQPLVTTGAIHMFEAAEGRAGSAEAARDAVKRAVGRDHANPTTWSLLGEIETHLGNSGGAREAFGRALQLDAWSARAMTGLGRLAVLDGDEAEGRRWLLRAVAVDPDGAAARLLAELGG